MFSGQNIAVINEETSLDSPTDVFDHEPSSIIDANYGIFLYSEKSYTDQNFICTPSETPDDNGIFENTNLYINESPLIPTRSHSSDITGRRTITRNRSYTVFMFIQKHANLR
jgi:hypothetical protein